MDLTTCCLGLSLPGPIVAIASPLNRDMDNLLRLHDGVAGAVVLPSVFEERIVRGGNPGRADRHAAVDRCAA